MIATMTLMTGCVTGSRTSGFCDLTKPIYLTKKEVAALTRINKEKLLAQNEFGADKCGWKPAK